MVVIMQNGAAKADLDAVLARVEGFNLRGSVTVGESQNIIGIVGLRISRSVPSLSVPSKWRWLVRVQDFVEKAPSLRLVASVAVIASTITISVHHHPRHHHQTHQRRHQCQHHHCDCHFPHKFNHHYCHHQLIQHCHHHENHK